MSYAHTTNSGEWIGANGVPIATKKKKTEDCESGGLAKPQKEQLRQFRELGAGHAHAAMWYNVCEYMQTRCMRICTVPLELEFIY